MLKYLEAIAWGKREDKLVESEKIINSEQRLKEKHG